MKKTDKSTGQKVEKEVIEPSEIRDEIRKFHQQIFNKQKIKEGTGAIDEFLNLDADTNPYKELEKTKLKN